MKGRPDARGCRTEEPEELGSCPGSAVSRPWVWGRAPSSCELHPSSVVGERLLDTSSEACPALVVQEPVGVNVSQPLWWPEQSGGARHALLVRATGPPGLMASFPTERKHFPAGVEWACPLLTPPPFTPAHLLTLHPCKPHQTPKAAERLGTLSPTPPQLLAAPEQSLTSFSPANRWCKCGAHNFQQEVKSDRAAKSPFNFPKSGELECPSGTISPCPR